MFKYSPFLELISALAAGVSIAVLFADFAHLATACSLIFGFLVFASLIYILSITCLGFVNCRSAKGLTTEDELKSPLNAPTSDLSLTSAAAGERSTDVSLGTSTETSFSNEDALNMEFCPHSCRTPRTICTACCGAGTLLIMCLTLILHFMVIGTKDPHLARAIPGIDGEIKVTISPSGLIHIHATTHTDVHFAQGLMTAELRLWQMEFQRRVGQGTLSELVGEPALGTDKMSRTLGLYAAAELAYKDLDEYSRRSLDSYSRGVNAYLNANTTLPLEMQLLGVDPSNIAPWRPADSLVWGKLMSLELSGNLHVEMLRYRMLGAAGMSFERVQEVIAPFDTERFPTVLTEEDLKSTDLRNHLGKVDAAAEYPSQEALEFYESYRGNISHGIHNHRTKRERILDERQREAAESVSESLKDILPFNLLRGRSPGRVGISHAASNNWVVHGNRTSTGLPLLANDPHLTLTAPSIWLATHLKVEAKDMAYTSESRDDSTEFGENRDLDVWGASFAGVPGIVIGRNHHISWGVTNTGADIQDLFVMEERRVNSVSEKHSAVDSKVQYLWNGQWLDYQTRTESIYVKGKSDPVELAVRNSKAGVVITDDEDVAVTLGMSSRVFQKNAKSLCLKWASIDPQIPDGSGAAFMHINLAQTYEEFRDALRPYVAPAQNFIFADKHGNIGYQMPGFIPRRAPGHTGRYPIAGDGRFAWRTNTTSKAPLSIQFDLMPRAFNPPKGFIASANNKVTPPGKIFPKEHHVLSHDWDGSNMGYRSRRITEMIQNLSALDPKDQVRKLDISGMKSIQLDYKSGLWVDFHPYLARLLNASNDESNKIKLSPAAESWAEILSDPKHFSGEMIVGAVEPTIFVRWLFGVLELISASSSGEHSVDASFLPDMAFNIVWVLGAFEKGDAACGGDRSANACLAFAAAKLEEAVQPYGDAEGKHFSGGAGKSSAVPRWGRSVHRAVFQHQILHTTPLSCAGDREIEHGGDDSTVNVGHVGSAPFYTQSAGPSYRQLVDLKNLNNNSLFLSPLGQSGDMFSPLYDNLLDDWGKGNYLKMGPDPKPEDKVRVYKPTPK